METPSNKSQFERLMSSAREKAAKEEEEAQPPKRTLHNLGHPWDHITGD